MAFVYKEKKDPLKIRPATALGPGQYLPITETKFIKVNDDRAPFESQELKFKPLSGTIRTNTPGPGTYYQDVDEVKIQKIKNKSELKHLNQEEIIQQDKYENASGNNINTKYNFRQNAEKLGFEVKDRRFKEIENYVPGPGKYFTESKIEQKIKHLKKNKNRIKSANPNLIRKKNTLLIPSIPFKDNGYDIDVENNLIKLENPESYKFFSGKKEDTVGPGSYQIDNPSYWHRNGTCWSKSKPNRLNSAISDLSKNSTRPQSTLNMRIVSANPSISKKANFKDNKRILSAQRDRRIDNIKYIRGELEKISKPVNDTNYYKEFEEFSNKQNPGPGYYYDMNRDSEFYLRSIPYPENKQFFLSNIERFPENSDKNTEVGPTTYFTNNQYYNSAFNKGNIIKNFDTNKTKKAPFSTRQKRFTTNRNERINLLNPGPGSYDPKLQANIEKNHFNNSFSTFGLRQKRFGENASNLKWQMNTPGPGSYINPYSATGTCNTVYINGLYLDIRKGKEILRPKSTNVKVMKKKIESPDMNYYDPQKLFSIGYNNKKKLKEGRESEKLNIAFNSHNTNKKNNIENGTRFKEKTIRSNLGPGYYYKEKVNKVTQINPPFHDSDLKYRDNYEQYEIGPGQYDSRSYFDWNKKTYNMTFI